MTKTDEKVDKDVIKAIEKSSEKFKQLYPVLVDAHDELIDGEHRKAVFKNPEVRKLNFIESKKDRLLARLVANHARKGQNKKTWTKTLSDLAQILEREGIDAIGMKISETTGLPYRTLMRYLPSEFKNQAQSERASHPRLPSGTPLPKETESETVSASAPSLVQTPAEKIETKELPSKGKAEEILGFSKFSEKEKPKIKIQRFVNQPWKAIILPADFFVKLEKACTKSQVDLEEVVTLALLKLLEDLRRKKPCLEKE